MILFAFLNQKVDLKPPNLQEPIHVSQQRPPYGHRPLIQLPLRLLVLLPALLCLDPHGGGVPRLWGKASHLPAALTDDSVGHLPVRREVIRRRSHVLHAWTSGQEGGRVSGELLLAVYWCGCCCRGAGRRLREGMHPATATGCRRLQLVVSTYIWNAHGVSERYVRVPVYCTPPRCPLATRLTLDTTGPRRRRTRTHQHPARHRQLQRVRHLLRREQRPKPQRPLEEVHVGVDTPRLVVRPLPRPYQLHRIQGPGPVRRYTSEKGRSRR